MAGKKEPKAVKALIKKHEASTDRKKQFVPLATLMDRIRRRKK